MPAWLLNQLTCKLEGLLQPIQPGAQLWQQCLPGQHAQHAAGSATHLKPCIRYRRRESAVLASRYRVRCSGGCGGGWNAVN